MAWFRRHVPETSVPAAPPIRRPVVWRNEVRYLAPQATTGPAWSSPNAPQYERQSSEAMVKGGYLADEYVYRCARYLAGELAKLPFRVGADPDKPDSWSKNAPLAKFLGPPPGSPCEQFTPADWWEYIALQWLIMGKIAVILQRQERGPQGQITGLWPREAQYVRPIPVPANSRGTSYFKAYDLHQPGHPAYRRFLPHEMVYCWRKSQIDITQPESVLEAAQLPVAVHKEMGLYNLSVLRNKMQESTIIAHGEFAEDQMEKEFREDFLSTTTGTSNAGRTMFVRRQMEVDPNSGNLVPGPGIEVHQLATSSKDAQMLEKQSAAINDICVAWGVPRSLLGDSSNSKFQNYAQDRLSFCRGPLQQLIRELTDQVNVHIAPLIGPQVGWFDTSGVPELQPDFNAGPAANAPVRAEAPPAADKTLPEPDKKAGAVEAPPAAQRSADLQRQGETADRFEQMLAATISALLVRQLEARARRGRQRPLDVAHWTRRAQQSLEQVYGVFERPALAVPSLAQRVVAAGQLIERYGTAADIDGFVTRAASLEAAV